jgi:hypothetical protein
MALGANHTATLATVLGADDATLEAAIKNVLDFFAVNES